MLRGFYKSRGILILLLWRSEITYKRGANAADNVTSWIQRFCFSPSHAGATLESRWTRGFSRTRLKIIAVFTIFFTLRFVVVVFDNIKIHVTLAHFCLSVCLRRCAVGSSIFM
jgi:hypothetical protein